MILLVVLTALFCCASTSQDTVSYWNRYWDESHAIDLSDATKALVPEHALVQADFEADLSGREEVTVYSVPVGQVESRPYILFSRNGKARELIDASKLIPVGPVEFRAGTFFHSGAFKALFFAFGTGVDGAGTYFFAMKVRNGKHSVFWHQHTQQGRIELSSNPVGFSLWTACCIEHDPLANNCVWCTHRYEVTSFRWQGNGFLAVKMYKTREHLNPEPFVEKAITIKTR